MQNRFETRIVLDPLMRDHAVAKSAPRVNAEVMDYEADRRRQALTRFMAAHKLKRGTLARRADISPNIIYNFFKGKSGYLSQPTLERISQTFNVPISDITGESQPHHRGSAHGMREPGHPGAEHGAAAAGSALTTLPGELTTLKILGSILGGAVWSESVFIEPEGEEHVSFNLPSLYSGKTFAVRLAGSSMDQMLPAGAILGCVAVADYLQQIRSGDIVLMVRRNQGGLFQTSVKQYLLEGTRHFLAARSADPRRAERVELFTPLDSPGAKGHQDFFIYAMVLSYMADLPASRR